MPDTTVNGVPLEAILKPLEWDPEQSQRIAGRTERVVSLDIVQPDPHWADYFQLFKSRILAAFQRPSEERDSGKITILAINHVGSTSVPELPAKAIIDIDLVLSSTGLASEQFYVPHLEAAGFEFRLRDPCWYERRFFWAKEPISCNLHVWGPKCAEVERHLIFRDWLRISNDDRELYATTKKQCAAASKENGEELVQYTRRKEWVIKDILLRAFEGLGYLNPQDS